MRALPFVLLVAASLAGCNTTRDTDRRTVMVEELDETPTGTITTRRGFSVDPGVAGWYGERGVALPLTDRPAYCHGFGCEFKTPIPLGDGAGILAGLFARATTPEQERRAIDLADQWWEKHAAGMLGGPADKRGSELGDAHKPGQTDCIDEATNTTTLLLWLERKGHLKFHHVRRPESRGAFLYAHATAVMTDTTTGIDWVADSWMRDSGDPIDVMPLETWFSLAYTDPK
ncbi:MAG: hypothetical protein ABTQ29_12035 [Siculibacillus sp.]